MKQCPIAAKIAGSIGILPRCDLNDLFTQGYERLPFVRPLLATILCIWEIWSPRIQCHHVFPCWQKKKLPKKCTKKKRVTAPNLKPTDDQKPENFCLLA